MADDITDPKRKDETTAPDSKTPETVAETPAADTPAADTPAADTPAADAPAAETGDKPVSESLFTQDPLKVAAGATQAPDETPKPDREPKAPEAETETPAPAAAADATATAPAAPTAGDDAAQPEDDAPAAPQATAPTADAEDEDKPKDDAPQAPQAATEETEEEKAKRKKAEAEAAAPQQQQPTPPLTDDDLKGTKFENTVRELGLGTLPILFAQKHMPTLNEVWGIGTVDPELIRAIGEDGEIRKHKNGLLFNLPNGHTIEWHHNLGGAEFIGMPRARAKFDETDAHAVVAASKSRGWQAINVHGTVEQKEMLWLEAMRQNMGVANFQPTQDSPVYQQWLKESTEKPDDQLTGISAAEHGEMRVPKGFKFEPAQPSDAPQTPDAPAQPETAAPETKAPEAAAPETKTADATAPAKAPETPSTPQESNFEEFLNRRAAVETDPNVQKGILAIREQVAKDPTVNTKDVENILGEKPDPAALGNVSKFFEARSGGNPPAAETKQPEVKQPAAVETPATPKTATPQKPKAAAPAGP